MIVFYSQEEKKKFDRESDRVCGLLDAHLKISPKKKDIILTEVLLEKNLSQHKCFILSFIIVKIFKFLFN